MGSAAAESLGRLRLELEQRFGTAIRPLPGGAPGEAPGGFRVGVRALDQLLPQGVPRGAATVWAGEAGAGRTAALRALVEAARRQARVALVDATGTLDAAAWCLPPDAAPLWVARAPGPGHAAEGPWVAEALLRTGCFGLVVLDGALPDPAEAHRLRALARESGAALLLSCGPGPTGWRADVRLEFTLGGADHPGLRSGGRFVRPAAVRLVRMAGAAGGARPLELVHEPGDLSAPPPEAADRRPGVGDWELLPAPAA